MHRDCKRILSGVTRCRWNTPHESHSGASPAGHEPMPRGPAAVSPSAYQPPNRACRATPGAMKVEFSYLEESDVETEGKW